MSTQVPSMGVVKTTPRREVQAVVYAAGGWIRGAFVVPKLHALLQHLNTTPHFVKMTNVSLPGLEKKIDFVALRVESFTFIIAQDDQALKSGRETIRQDVSCLFPFGYINGKIETMPGMRVSDFVVANPRYFPLYDCTIRLTGQQPTTEPVVVINAEKILGISQPPIS